MIDSGDVYIGNGGPHPTGPNQLVTTHSPGTQLALQKDSSTNRIVVSGTGGKEVTDTIVHKLNVCRHL